MKKAVVLMIILALALPVVSCKSGPASESGKVTVLLDWVPNTNHTGLYAAKELGYFEEEGLEVEILQVNEGGTAHWLRAGQASSG